MKIKITNCSDSMYWYAKHVGATIEVHKRDKEMQAYWCKEIDSPYLNFVLYKDCEVIKEEVNGS